MTAEDLRNKGACGAGSALGFNTDKGCAALLTAAAAIWLLSPSLVIVDGQEIDLDFIKGLQKAGQLVVIPNVSTFAENGNDDAVETLDDDTMIPTNEGKYKYLATFVEDLYFNKALHSVKGFGGWATAIVDKAGNVFLTHRVNGGGDKGFKTGMIKPQKLQVASNTTSTKQGLEFQLLKRAELDTNYTVWENDLLGFDPREVEPIAQAELAFVNAPAATDTTIVVSTTMARGRKGSISGAVLGQFRLLVNGASEAITAVTDNADGTYTLAFATALVLADVVEVDLYNVADSEQVIEIVDDCLYKSEAIEAIAV